MWLCAIAVAGTTRSAARAMLVASFMAFSSRWVPVNAEKRRGVRGTRLPLFGRSTGLARKRRHHLAGEAAQILARAGWPVEQHMGDTRRLQPLELRGDLARRPEQRALRRRIERVVEREHRGFAGAGRIRKLRHALLVGKPRLHRLLF